MTFRKSKTSYILNKDTFWLMSKVMAMMAGLLEMAGAKVEEEELVEACNQVMAAIDADGDGEVLSHQHLDLLFFLV